MPLPVKYKQRTPKEVLDAAVTLLKTNSDEQTALALGISATTASTIRKAYNAAESRDIALLAHLGTKSGSIANWAAEKFGIPLDLTALKRLAPQKANDTARPPTANRPDTDRPPTGGEQLLPIASNCSEDNTAQAMVNILTKLDEITSALSRVCGAIINLQNCMVEQQKIITHTIDVNCDIVAQEVIRNKDILDGIKCNTRPRKGQ